MIPDIYGPGPLERYKRSPPLATPEPSAKICTGPGPLERLPAREENEGRLSPLDYSIPPALYSDHEADDGAAELTGETDEDRDPHPAG